MAPSSLPTGASRPPPPPSRSEARPSPAALIDAVARRSLLTASQSEDLHNLVWLAGSDTPLGQVLSQIVISAQMFHLANLCLQIAQKDNTATDLLQDVKTIFESDSSLTARHKANVIAVAKDVLVCPVISSYTNIQPRVEQLLSNRKQEYGLTAFFNNPAREHILAAYIKESCRSARNQLRKAFMKAVKECNTHTEVAIDIAKKFRLGKMHDLPGNFAGRIIMILNFARENVDAPEERDDDNDDDDEAEEAEDHADSTSRKRQRTTAKQKGRIPKGTSFWDRFDALLKDKIKEFGRDLASPAWTDYVRSLMDEERTYHKRAVPPAPRFADAMQDLVGNINLNVFTPHAAVPSPPQQSHNRSASQSPAPRRRPQPRPVQRGQTGPTLSNSGPQSTLLASDHRRHSLSPAPSPAPSLSQPYRSSPHPEPPFQVVERPSSRQHYTHQPTTQLDSAGWVHPPPPRPRANALHPSPHPAISPARAPHHQPSPIPFSFAGPSNSPASASMATSSPQHYGAPSYQPRAQSLAPLAGPSTMSRAPNPYARPSPTPLLHRFDFPPQSPLQRSPHPSHHVGFQPHTTPQY